LNLELGDLAVLLDLRPRFSVMDAISNADRLDWDFLSGLMVEHSSGVSLLAAPDSFGPRREATKYVDAILQVLRLLSGQFPYVVFDAATNQNLPEQLLQEFQAIYLVSQVDIPSLRHAQRISAHLASHVEHTDHTDRSSKPERQRPVQIVLNRFDPKRSMIAAEEIEKSLEMAVSWRIPNDYASVRDAGNTGILSSLTSSDVGKAVRGMAEAVYQKHGAAAQDAVAKKKGWRLFG
jgi:pilus assembly protein CpaE